LALAGIEESELLDVDVAPLGQADGQGDLGEKAAVGEVFAGAGDEVDAEVALEVVLDFGGGAGLADLAEMVDQGGEEVGDAVGDVAVDCGEGGLDGGPGLPAVQEVGVDGAEKVGIEMHGLREDFSVGEKAAAEDLDAGEGVGGVDDPERGVIEISAGDEEFVGLVDGG
jgi:hypothetical protein